MPDRPPRQARLFSFATGQPIDDDPSIIEALDMLSRIAGRAMVDGADPSASVSPDHHLLLCCDAAIMLKRQHTQLEDRWRALSIGNPEHDRVQSEWQLVGRAVQRLLRRIGKLQAQTPSGIFAKAAAVHGAGPGAAFLATSLARDLLASPELRRAVWPAAEQRG
jgi:hypothetical protein